MVICETASWVKRMESREFGFGLKTVRCEACRGGTKHQSSEKLD